jgi:DNA-binding cell septation regulator SpoVG
MISALNYKPYDSGAIRGFFDLRYHGLTIKGCRLMDGSYGLWIALPKKKGEQNGETKWFDQMYLTPPEQKHVCQLVLIDLQNQGHIQGPAVDKQAPRQPMYITPEGEDLSGYYPQGGDDIHY